MITIELRDAPFLNQFSYGYPFDLRHLDETGESVRGFRRVEAKCQVVSGYTVKATSETFDFANSVLRNGVKFCSKALRFPPLSGSP